MSDETDAQENPAARMSGPIRWRVVDVQPLARHRLAVRFADGTHGEVDVSSLVFGTDAGVFAGLRDPAVFAQVHIAHGAVTWPGDLDLAPDAMYHAIRADGCWTPM